jgi:hypothetical protein
MKSIRVFVIVIFVFSVAYLPCSYAEENFVTSENLSSSDVEHFVEALFREETPIGSASQVTIEGIEQEGNRAVVNCDFCYPETPFASVKHVPRTVIFERTESGKWIHVATGKYLTK